MFVLTAQICRVGFRRVSRQPESHMMSQTVTQAGCLIPTQRPSCTMSYPGHPACRIGGSNAELPASGLCAHCPCVRRLGPVGEPRGRVGERVMSRAAVGGSPGGEAPLGEFSESSAALH